jgi:hypothetical protein
LTPVSFADTFVPLAIQGGSVDMSTGKHYYIEQTADGRFAVRANGSEKASAVFDTQQAAIAHVRLLNSDDKPNIERVRKTKGGRPDKWR